ncbi:MAG: protein kinase [Gemmataceae bacterium]
MPTPQRPSDEPSLFDRTQVQDTATPLPSVTPADEPRAGDSSSRYRIIRTFATGGLGIIYIAEDTELRRRVALKEIQLRYADDARSRHRFLLEAEITGRLAHPGIVPIYGLGQYADGRPYYSMRFVEGETLQDALSHLHATTVQRFDNVEMRTLLRRFIDVCNAVAYAHSQNVIHRDLKPANVLLGRFGETLLIDWGLAKFVGQIGERPDPFEPAGPASTAEPHDPCGFAATGSWTLPVGDATQMGTAIGTPGFMPPEQAAGRWDEVGPASDIYSLGATLFAILAGKPAQTLPTGDATTPQSVNPLVPCSLDAICRKAMAQRREDRYTSPSELATDIEHWLAGDAVSAMAEGLPTKVGRWARRHQTLVTGIVASGLATLLGLAIVVWILSTTNDQLRDANAMQAVLRERAEHSVVLAQARQRETRRAVDAFFTEVSESPRLLRKEPGTQELRRELLTQARDYYEQFLRENNGDAALQTEAASACFRLARILDELSPGQRPLELYERALAMQVALLAAAPDDPTRIEHLAETENHIGTLRQNIGDAPKAIESFTRARVLYERLNRSHPARPRLPLYHARTLDNLGVATYGVGSPDAAMAAFTEARGMLTSNVADPDYRRELARTLLNLGGVQRATGRADDAWVTLKDAKAAMEPLATVTTPRPDDLQRLAGICNQLANVELSLGRANAMDTYDRARALWERLSHDNPGVDEFTQEHARTLGNIGTALFQRGDAIAALDSLRRSLGILEALARSRSDIPSYVQDVARTHNNLGRLLVSLGRRTNALSEYTLAIEAHSKLLATSPGQQELSHEYARFLRNRGILLTELRRHDAARSDIEQSLSLRERLPASPATSSDIAESLIALADLTRQTGRAADSLAEYQRALAILVAQPTSLTKDRLMRAAHFGRAESLALLGRFDDAKADWDAAGASSLVQLGRAASEARDRRVVRFDVVRDLSGSDAKGEQLFAAARVYGYATKTTPDAAARAVELLQRSFAIRYLADPTWADTLASDDAFVGLRERPEFCELIANLRKLPVEN